MESVEGVAVKELDFDTKTVTVMVEPGTDTKAMVSALEEAGFGGSVQ